MTRLSGRRVLAAPGFEAVEAPTEVEFAGPRRKSDLDRAVEALRAYYSGHRGR